MSKPKSDSEKYVYIYIEGDEQLVRLHPDESYASKKKDITKKILSSIDEFKMRGERCVKPELIPRWIKFIDKSLSNDDFAWYSGSAIEAALQCMERLSSGVSVEDVYCLIDFRSLDEECIFFDKGLSYNQKCQIARVVGQYHSRGEEFTEYIIRRSSSKPKTKKEYSC